MGSSLSPLAWLALRLPPVSCFQIQGLAARCIQKNLAVFQAVKNWPWWQLMCRVRPLLTISLAEGQLQAKEVRRPPSMSCQEGKWEQGSNPAFLKAFPELNQEISEREILATPQSGAPRCLGRSLHPRDPRAMLAGLQGESWSNFLEGNQ